MDNLYQENILDHAHNPRNKKIMSDATCHAKGDNPSCGDIGTLYIKFSQTLPNSISDKNDKVSEASFDGVGCAISQASMSMMTEFVNGKTIHELKMIMPGDVYKMLGVSITPPRVNCALLSYRALEQLLPDCANI